MTNRSDTLYIGMTNNLARRIWQHRVGTVEGFAATYRIDRLIYAETFSEVRDAIAREKQLKGWRREKKVALIAATNPEWKDLGEEWLETPPSVVTKGTSNEVLRQAQDDT
ncbi:MAG: GIY-YIG nuclease family protein [Chloroflexia bacterium]|nr:GIY-YIG nuclease family protein [Chloroflexia bacterium]